MKLKLLCAALALTCGTANAGLILIGGVSNGANGKTTGRAGACSVLFNGGNATNSCGASYYEGGLASTTPIAASHFVTGNISGIAATPAGDTTTYFTVGPAAGSTTHIALTTPANYFGFYAGSLDTFNLVQFFLGGVMVDSFTGTQINAVAFPGQATDGDQSEAQYIDYFPTGLYDNIVYSSTGNAFETDSHAFGVVRLGAPEPGSVALLALGSIAFLATRRRRSQR